MTRILSKIALAAAFGAAGVAGLLAFSAAPANAGALDIESTASGDPNLITQSNSIPIIDAAGAVMSNELLVIVGAYDGIGEPSVSFAGSTIAGETAQISANPVGSLGNIFGLTADTASFPSSDRTDKSVTAYSLLGLSAGTVQDFQVWSAQDAANGFAAPSSFTLYAFGITLSNAMDGVGQAIDLSIGGVEDGSFVLAYSCAASGCSNYYAVGNSVDGLYDAPEPASLTLFAGALLGLFVVKPRRRRSPGDNMS